MATVSRSMGGSIRLQSADMQSAVTDIVGSEQAKEMVDALRRCVALTLRSSLVLNSFAGFHLCPTSVTASYRIQSCHQRLLHR